MYRNLFFILGGCAILFAIFFVAFNGTADGRADYVWANGTEPETLDIAFMTGQPEGDIATAIFEGLTVYHPESLAPMPGVADSWDVDGLTYTFHLRPDAWWIKEGNILEVGGKKRNVTAHDFVYSWMRQCLPETGSQYSFLLDFIEGIEDFKAESAKHWQAICKERTESGLPIPKDLSELKPAIRDEVTRFRDQLWTKLVGVRAVDNQTLEVKLKSPITFFFQLTSFYSLMPSPREAIEEHGNEWTLPRNIVTNGPYWLESWRFNFKIRLHKNAHYWETQEYADRRIQESSNNPDPTPDEVAYIKLVRDLGPFVERGIETLDALAIEKEDTSLNLYLNGDNDKVRSLPTHVVADLLEENRKSNIPDLHHSSNPTVYYYDVNLTLPVFQREQAGRELRQALTLAIDRPRLIREIARANQSPALSMVRDGFVPGYHAEPRLGTGDFEQDLELAKQLLAEAKDAGLVLPNLRIVYNNLEAHKAIAAFLQDQWKRHLGIDVTLENQEWQVYLNSRRQGNFDLARAAWIPDYSDPNTFLDMFTSNDFDSDRSPSDREIEYNSQNHGKYNNPHYNRIVLQYCMRMPQYLSTAEQRHDIIEDVRSWPGFHDAIESRVRTTGTTTIQDLESHMAHYEAADSHDAKVATARQIRLTLLEIAEQMLMYDLPVIPLYHYTMTQLWPPELTGIAMNERDAHPQKYLRWKNGKRPTHTRYRDFPHLWPRLD